MAFARVALLAAAAAVGLACTHASEPEAGYVVVRFDVDHEGRVSNVAVVESHPDDRFNVSAIAAVKEWRYDPTAVEAPKEGVEVRLDFQRQ